MAKAFFHGLPKGFRGKIGNLIFRLMPDGTTVVTAAQEKRTGRDKKRAKLKRSPRQNEHNDRFQQSARYGRWAAKNYPIYAELAAAEPMKTAYNFAVSDWFHPPEIHHIQRKDGRILVQATDNVMVTRVQVTVLDENDQVLEKGEAERNRGDWWEFSSNPGGTTIVAEAWDLAKNVTKVVQSLPL